MTLFVNYSYKSFYDFCFSENTYREQKVMCQKYKIFNFIWGLYMDIYPTYYSVCIAAAGGGGGGGVN